MDRSGAIRAVNTPLYDWSNFCRHFERVSFKLDIKVINDKKRLQKKGVVEG